MLLWNIEMCKRDDEPAKNSFNVDGGRDASSIQCRL